MGFTVYPVTKQIGDSKYLQGTFPRYNHMTNVLTTIFAVLAFEYFGSTKKKSTILALTWVLPIVRFVPMMEPIHGYGRALSKMM